jgi:pre-60S factor REI1
VAKAPAVFEKNHKKCFFCEKVSRDLQENEEHMQNAHSFFIAQREFCKNPEGLIEYLQEKIEVGNMCITCENKKAKDFQSADAVRKHMVDRGHSIMKTEEGFEEYEKYYDFTRLFEEKLKEQERPVPGIEYQKVKVLVDD